MYVYFILPANLSWSYPPKFYFDQNCPSTTNKFEKGRSTEKVEDNILHCLGLKVTLDAKKS